MFDGFQSGGLLFWSTLEKQPDVRTAKIRRNMDFADGCGADPGVGQLVIDQFVQFLAETFRDAFIAVRVQISGYTRQLGLERQNNISGGSTVHQLKRTNTFRLPTIFKVQETRLRKRAVPFRH